MISFSSCIFAAAATKFQYTDGVADVSRIDPDNWVHDQALLDRPGNKDVQLDLFQDYIVWGKNDRIFPADGATPYFRDLPDAEMHLLDTGHFALEDQLDVMPPIIRSFLDHRN